MAAVLALTATDFDAAAARLGVATPILRAVHEVETAGGNGFLEAGKPVILFEGHVFWRQLEMRGIPPAALAEGNENILYPRWNREHYRGGVREYARLARALRIHEEAALCATSWGMFQLMGFNHEVCGYEHVVDFVQAMCCSPGEQLEAFVCFVRKRGLVRYLQCRDWEGFARRYNGSGFALNRYDEKLRRAYERFAAGKEPPG